MTHICRCAECGATMLRPGSQGNALDQTRIHAPSKLRPKLGLGARETPTFDYVDAPAAENSQAVLAPASARTETFKNSAAALEQQMRGMAPAAKHSAHVEYKPAESIEDNHG